MRGGRQVKRVIGPLALLFCVGALVLVYLSAFGVGSVRSRRRNEFFVASQRVVEKLQAELTQCQEYIANVQDHSSNSSFERQAIQEDLEAVQVAIEDRKELLSKTNRVLLDCRRSLKELQVKLHGAEGSNPEAALDRLRVHEQQLKKTLAQLESMDAEARAATREGVDALQAVLLWQTSRLFGNTSVETQYLAACVERARTERYSVVFDIGSTGNRIHVYKFSYDGSLDRTMSPSVWNMKLESELFQANNIRMSEQETRESAIAALDDLFVKGLAVIPEEARPCTPVEFKATAGLRKKGPVRAAVILGYIRSHYMKNSPLWIRGESPARVIEGSEEGPLAWVTVNYLLGNFKASSKGETAAVIDLGGGSTQIVVEPAPGAMPRSVRQEDLFISEDLGGRRVIAYQHSYEGLGLNEAAVELIMEVQGKCADPVHHEFARPKLPQNQDRLDDDDDEDDDADKNDDEDQTKPKNGSGGGEEVRLRHPDEYNMAHFPCFPRGYSDAGVGNVDLSSKGSVSATKSTPDFEKCVELFNKYVLVRKTDAQCPEKDCGMRGQHQPSLADFSGPIYAFSYIYDYVKGHRQEPGNDRVTVAEVGALARKQCDAMTPEYLAAARETAVAGKPPTKPEYECMHLSYVYALLRYGYGIPDDRELVVTKKINGYEAAWTLGAALMTLSSLNPSMSPLRFVN